VCRAQRRLESHADVALLTKHGDRTFHAGGKASSPSACSLSSAPAVRPASVLPHAWALQARQPGYWPISLTRFKDLSYWRRYFAASRRMPLFWPMSRGEPMLLRDETIAAHGGESAT
jgi:hypothetical protein